MIDINTIFNNAVTAAVEAHITAIQQQHANIVGELTQRIATLEQQLSTVGVTDIINDAINAQVKAVVADHGLEVNMDALRNLVKPMIDSVVDQAIQDHCEGYDHDSYDNVVNAVDDLPDFDDFVRGDELDSNVRDAVNNLTFEVSVS